ncbi:MAG: hypothetical protein ACREN3_14725 [Gemmatimonadaceae bacterium]
MEANLLNGTLTSTTRLPYVPNSMVMDEEGDSLYFGSARELMVYSTLSNAITAQSASTPGVVLAVSPSDSQVLVNDQARHLFYLYNAAGGGSTNFGGMGEAAAWTPDGQTLYIVDNANLNSPAGCAGGPLITGHTDTLYVYNLTTGWATYALPPSPLPPDAVPTCSTEPNTAPVLTVPSQPDIAGPLTAQAPAVMIPSVGAYMRGTPTTANTWCPSGTVGGTLSYFPQGDPGEAVQSDALATTVDGDHILTSAWTATGAGSTTGTLSFNDIGVQIPTTQCPETTSVSGVQTLSPLVVGHPAPPFTTLPIVGLANVVSVDQVLTGPLPVTNGSSVSSNSLAFVTYSASAAPVSGNALLPYYVPGSGGAAGTLGYVTLKTASGSPAAIAPIAGAFSPDDTTFFVSTTGDDEIHYISIPSNVSASTPPTDKQQISPNLPACTLVSAGGLDAGCVYSGSSPIVPTTAITVVPRAIT